MTRPQKVIFIALGFLAFVLNLWMMNRPPHSTATEWLLVARDLPMGKIPYRDFFIHVGPAAGYFLGLFFWIFSPTLLTAALVYVGVNFLTAWGLYRLSRLYLEPWVALTAALMYGFSVPFFGGSDMFVEPFVALLGIWGMLLMYQPSKSRVSFALAILLFTLAFLTKQTGIVYLCAWGLGELIGAIRKSNEGRKNTLIKLITATGLFCTLFLLTSAYYYSQGAIQAFWYQFFIFNFKQWYPFSVQSTIFDVVLGVAPWIFLLGFYGCAQSIFKKGNLPIGLFWVIPPVFLHCVRVPYHHYFIVALPFMALFAAKGYQSFFFHNASVNVRMGKVLILALFLIPTLGRMGVALIRPFGIPPVFQRLLENTPFSIGSMDPESLYWDLKASDELKKLIPEGARFYTDHPIFYFYLNQQSPWNADLLNGEGIIHDPRFAEIDTILLTGLRLTSATVIPRPEYIPKNFSEKTILLDTGQISVVALYTR
ncbi:MAG: hypothetical protein KCHDKBKB_01843 [Elusimicrobia bacterium]|nr:hypothetical protein [Elusimicrobiota bacterium]